MTTGSIPTLRTTTTASTATPPKTAATRSARTGLLLAGLLLLAANLRAGITSVGPVLGDIRESLGLSAVTASVLISVPLVAFAVVSPVAPALARRIGLERALGAALGVLAVAIVVRSLPPVWALWTGTALLGVAIAVLNVAIPALVKRDFPTRIGPITGLYSAVQGAVAAIAAGAAVPIAGVAQEGWRLAIGVWAALALIGLAVFAPQLRSRTLPEPDLTPGELRHRSPWGSAIGWQVTLFMGLQSTVFYTLITWLPSIERAAGIPSATAGLHQLFFNGMGIAGSLACAAIIPRLRDQRPIAIGATALLLGAVTGILLAPAWSGVWVCLAGVGGGATIVLALSLFGLRTSHHDQAAALSGMAQSVGYLLAALGPIGVGLLHDLTGSWPAAIGVLVVVLVAQLVAGTLAARDRVIAPAPSP